MKEQKEILEKDLVKGTIYQGYLNSGPMRYIGQCYDFEGNLRIIMEPIFESLFKEMKPCYRPDRKWYEYQSKTFTLWEKFLRWLHIY
jgi:hypothetical protein